jgi:hypothetical protein
VTYKLIATYKRFEAVHVYHQALLRRLAADGSCISNGLENLVYGFQVVRIVAPGVTYIIEDRKNIVSIVFTI